MKNIELPYRTVNQLLLTLIILLIACPIYSKTHRIKQDGFGDFVTITAGINAAVNGDTLLVYPGRYIENLNYNGKNITITSLYEVESTDRSIIRETVIDGNKQGSVVTFDSGETRDAVLNGLTITNGYAREGGGIRIINGASPIIINCILSENRATLWGGGMALYDSSAVIKNNIVEYNQSFGPAGILHYSGNSKFASNIIRYNNALSGVGGFLAWEAILCSECPNSVYCNYAGNFTNDLSLKNIDYSPVIIDTFTVISPDPYSKYFISGPVTPDGDAVTLIIRNAKITPVSANLYISSDGSDTNSGLTPEEPLKTIALAMSMINPDIPERRNIFVADGIYSKTLNGQFFPVQVRSNVNVIGGSKEGTILDMENKTWAFSAYMSIKYSHIYNFSIKNFSIFNGGYIEDRASPSVSGIYVYSAHSFEVENIGIYDGEAQNLSAFHSEQTANYNIKNIEIENCKGSGGILAMVNTWVTDESYGYLENIRINNFSYREGYEGVLTDIGQSFVAGRTYSVNKPTSLTIVNLEITDGVIGNNQPHSDFSFIGASGGKPDVPARTELRLINATVGNNKHVGRHGGGVLLSGNMDTEIYNSIIYGNRPHNFNVANRYGDDMNVSVYNSIIENGFTGVQYYKNAYADIYWDESNLDINPLFFGENDLGLSPYSLTPLSPAIGAGTLDIPDFEFSEYDLAGNPRIVDGRIDMGAYQYQGPTEVRESDFEANRLREGDFNLRNFPNPATTLLNHSTVGVEGHRSSTTGTNIAFELPESGRVMIEIYNLKGQFVKRVYDAYIPKGEHNVFWDGRNEKGQFVATGFYMYNLHFNEQLVATGRATFIK